MGGRFFACDLSNDAIVVQIMGDFFHSNEKINHELQWYEFYYASRKYEDILYIAPLNDLE